MQYNSIYLEMIGRCILKLNDTLSPGKKYVVFLKNPFCERRWCPPGVRLAGCAVGCEKGWQSLHRAGAAWHPPGICSVLLRGQKLDLPVHAGQSGRILRETPRAGDDMPFSA